MMEEGLQIRDLVPSDIPAVCRMLGPLHAFSRPESFFEWQFFRLPHPRCVRAAFFKGELAGIAGIQVRKLTNGKPVGQASWLNVSPAFRRRGVLRALLESAESAAPRHSISCVFANAGAREPMSRCGYEFIGEICHFELSAGERPKPVGEYREETITENTVFPLPPDAAGGGVFKFVSDAPFMRWRYGMCPLYRYSLISGAEGFAVCKVFVDPVNGAKTGDIVEYYPASPGNLAGLLAQASESLFKKGAGKVSTWSQPEKEFAAACSTLGFTRGRADTSFAVKQAPDESVAGWLDLGAWHLQQADATNY